VSDPKVFLYDRRVVLAVAVPLAQDYARVSGDVVEISDLRVKFKITKSLAKDPNTAEVVVYNLAETTRARMQKQAAKVVVRAGYLNTVGQIFVGDSHSIEHTREGSDWVTKIQCGDGARSLTQARVSQSFGAGSTVNDVVGAVGKVAGFDVTQLLGAGKLKALQQRQFTGGYAAHGPAGDVLDRLLRGAGVEWSVQDGKLQVLERGRGSTERIVELDSTHGLVGSPTYATAEKRGRKAVLKFKALLSSEIRPGRRLAFTSAEFGGVHRVLKVTHSGDTHGGEWYTEGEAEVT
jgi:hypothetical protein